MLAARVARVLRVPRAQQLLRQRSSAVHTAAASSSSSSSSLRPSEGDFRAVVDALRARKPLASLSPTQQTLVARQYLQAMLETNRQLAEAKSEYERLEVEGTAAAAEAAAVAADSDDTPLSPARSSSSSSSSSSSGVLTEEEAGVLRRAIGRRVHNAAALVFAEKLSFAEAVAEAYAAGDSGSSASAVGTGAQQPQPQQQQQQQHQSGRAAVKSGASSAVDDLVASLSSGSGSGSGSSSGGGGGGASAKDWKSASAEASAASDSALASPVHVPTTSELMNTMRSQRAEVEALYGAEGVHLFDSVLQEMGVPSVDAMDEASVGRMRAWLASGVTASPSIIDATTPRLFGLSADEADQALADYDALEKACLALDFKPLLAHGPSVHARLYQRMLEEHRRSLADADASASSEPATSSGGASRPASLYERQQGADADSLLPASMRGRVDLAALHRAYIKNGSLPDDAVVRRAVILRHVATGAFTNGAFVAEPWNYDAYGRLVTPAAQSAGMLGSEGSDLRRAFQQIHRVTKRADMLSPAQAAVITDSPRAQNDADADAEASLRASDSLGLPTRELLEYRGYARALSTEDTNAVFADGFAGDAIRDFHSGGSTMLVREPAVHIMSDLDSFASGRTGTGRKGNILFGRFGSGKSMVLNSIVYHARKNDWLVLNVPSMMAFTDGRHNYDVYPGKHDYFPQPDVAAMALQRFAKANARFLQHLPVSALGDVSYLTSPPKAPALETLFGKTELSRGDDTEESQQSKFVDLDSLYRRGILERVTLPRVAVADVKTVYDAICAGVHRARSCPPLFEAVCTMLASQREFPVLVAIDQFNRLFDLSQYETPDLKRIPSRKLSMGHALDRIVTSGLESGYVIGAFSDSIPQTLRTPVADLKALGYELTEVPYYSKAETWMMHDVYSSAFGTAQIPDELPRDLNILHMVTQGQAREVFRCSAIGIKYDPYRTAFSEKDQFFIEDSVIESDLGLLSPEERKKAGLPEDGRNIRYRYPKIQSTLDELAAD